MKHPFYALGAIAAASLLCAHAAQAQSSVKIYGIIENSVEYVKTPLASKTALDSSDFYATRFGFSGTEDLGGGMKTNWALEAGVSYDTGTGAATNTNNQASGATTAGGLTFNRQSWVGLENSMGEIRFGRNFNPTFRQYVNYDPFLGGGAFVSQAAMSSLATYGASRRIDPTTGAAQAAAAPPNGVRSSNAIEYWLPGSGALTGQFMYAMGENPSGSVTSRDGNYYSGRLAYQLGDANIGIAAGKDKNSTYRDIDEFVLGARYKLGDITPMAMYTRSKTGLGAKQSGWLLGGIARYGAMEYRVSFSTSNGNTTSALGKSRKLAATASYFFSKRTLVWVGGAYVRNTDGASSSVVVGGLPPGVNGNLRLVSLGMTHFF